MMGFWDITKRVLQGKPAFQSAQHDEWEDDAPTDEYAEERHTKRDEIQERDLYDQNGEKHPPVVEVSHAKYTLSGTTTEVWATICNRSDREVVLDKIDLFGSIAQLNYPLHPNQQREFRVYSGPQQAHDNYKKAQLYYKDVLSGDYFRADHLISYTYEHEFYHIGAMKLINPIYDI